MDSGYALKAESIGFAGSLDMKLQRKTGCERVKGDMWVPGLGNRKDGEDGVTLYEKGSGHPRSRFGGMRVLEVWFSTSLKTYWIFKKKDQIQDTRIQQSGILEKRFRL